jgi:hypothetical protein
MLGDYRIFLKKVQIRKGNLTWRIDGAVANGIPELDLKRQGHAYRTGIVFQKVRRFWLWNARNNVEIGLNNCRSRILVGYRPSRRPSKLVLQKVAKSRGKL